MINAKMARDLVEQSAVMSSARLEKISDKITELASDGKTEMVLDWEFPDEWVYRPVKRPYGPVELTAAQQKLKKDLEDRGFGFTVFEHKSEHMEDAFQDPEVIVTQHFKVSW